MSRETHAPIYNGRPFCTACGSTMPVKVLSGVKPRLSVSSNRCVISWNKYQGATKYKIVAVDPNKKILAERVTTKTTFDWRGFAKGKKYGFYIVPFVGNDYIPFGRSYTEDQANIVYFTAK